MEAEAEEEIEGAIVEADPMAAVFSEVKAVVEEEATDREDILAETDIEDTFDTISYENRQDTSSAKKAISNIKLLNGRLTTYLIFFFAAEALARKNA